MKMSVLYHSKSGNTKQMAEAIVAGAAAAPGVAAKAFSIDAVDEAFVKESACVIFGTPVYYASVSGATKAFLDNEARKLGLAGKLGGAFATAEYLHGGGDVAIQSILSHLMVLGMLAFSGGGSFGAPVIHLGPVALGASLEQSTETFRLYGQRMATKAQALFG